MKAPGNASRASLDHDTTADVCIVGAGIAGLTTAWKLVCDGRTVVVLDAGDIAGGESSRTTAQLVNALDTRYTELERLHGASGVRLAAESHTAAIAEIEAICQQEQIACDFTRLDGFLFGTGDEVSALLNSELAAAHRAGLLDVERLPRVPVTSFNSGPCLRFPDQAQIHPTLYLKGLAAAIERRGGRIFTGTHVDAIHGGASALVTTSTGNRVTAGAVVVATNTPINDVLVIHTKQAAYRTYVGGLRIPSGSVARGLYWDTLDPFHYVRLHSEAGSDILIVGGEDHKTGQEGNPTDRFERLTSWARERFPLAQDLVQSWSGQVIQSIDGLAYIGRNPLDEENVYIVTGDSGNGMTHGTLAGILLTDLIQGRPNPWAPLYDPSRITSGAALEFARENVNVATQYATLLTGGDISSAAELLPNQAGILREGLTKTALYRDAEGVLHALDATCPHLGCIVAWNISENTWDCPCHGSRFSPLGKVLNGPAVKGLSRR